MRRSRSAFTLIEVLLVITYIAVLALIVVPRFSGAQRRAKEAALRATLHIMRDATASYQAETGAFPASLDDLVATTAPATGLNSDGSTVAIIPADWHGPYIRYAGGTVPKDPVTSQSTWLYQTSPPNVGQINSLADGDDLEGKPYSEY
jgi:prepilin-type N-terminal cleavage/methylation domain-containing protein